MEEEEEPGRSENELFGESGNLRTSVLNPSPQYLPVKSASPKRGEGQKSKAPHTPGLWVLYFSLAALPLFGIGQKWIPVGDVGRRQYAFGLSAVYVAAGLALLVTTSFLGLRRYLRQRRVEMPTPMAATWVVTGGVLIVVVMMLAALIPRPQAEYAISQVPWQARSKSDLAASRTSFGYDGTEDENTDARSVINEETDPNATATREGDNSTTASEEGEQQASGGESREESEHSPSKQADGESDGSEESGSSEAGESDSPSQQPATSEQSESAEESDPSPSAASNSTPAEPSEESRQAKSSRSDSASETVRPPPSLPDVLSSLGGLAAMVKLALYAVFALAVIFLAWRQRQQIAAAIADIIRLIREFLAQLFGGRSAKPTSGAADNAEKTVGLRARPFASFADPFASGQFRSLPPDEVVRYTFEAFEAWARERGFPRTPDQTPLELIRQAIPKQSPLHAEARQLGRLYNEAAYAPSSVSATAVQGLAQFWALLRKSSQTPLEPVS